MQLGILASNIPCEATQNFDAIITYLRELSQTLLLEVCTLASLILVMPATNAVSERSFSALRRLKTYLRSTMTQTRLNNIKVLHIHNHLTCSQLSLIEIARNEFIKCFSHREAILEHVCQPIERYNI